MPRYLGAGAEMQDALLVDRSRAGDLDSFGQLYDLYFHRVYDFAWRVLGDVDAAAEVTARLFADVARDPQSMPASPRFQAWLFGRAHAAVIARTEAEGGRRRSPAVHEEAFGSFDVPDPSRIDAPHRTPADQEYAALVWEATTSLGARDYALLDLHLRQDLGSGELADVLEVSKSAAATMVTRMKAAAADAITSYIVARRGAGGCPGLAETLSAFSFPPYTDEIRRGVDTHIRECAICKRTQSALAAPLETFSSFAPALAPMSLKGDTWREIAAQWPARRATLVDAAGPRSGRHTQVPASPQAPSGSPAERAWSTAPSINGDRNQLLWFAGAAAGLLFVAFLGAAVAYGAFGGGGGGGATAPATATRTAGPQRTPSPAGTAPGVALQTPTVDLTPSSTPPPTETPTPEPQPPTATAVPPTPIPPTAPRPSATPIPPKPTATPRGGRAPTATKCPPGGCPTP